MERWVLYCQRRVAAREEDEGEALVAELRRAPPWL